MVTLMRNKTAPVPELIHINMSSGTDWGTLRVTWARCCRLGAVGGIVVAAPGCQHLLRTTQTSRLTRGYLTFIVLILFLCVLPFLEMCLMGLYL